MQGGYITNHIAVPGNEVRGKVPVFLNNSLQDDNSHLNNRNM